MPRNNRRKRNNNNNNNNGQNTNKNNTNKPQQSANNNKKKSEVSNKSPDISNDPTQTDPNTINQSTSSSSSSSAAEVALVAILEENVITNTEAEVAETVTELASTVGQTVADAQLGPKPENVKVCAASEPVSDENTDCLDTAPRNSVGEKSELAGSHQDVETSTGAQRCVIAESEWMARKSCVDGVDTHLNEADDERVVGSTQDDYDIGARPVEGQLDNENVETGSSAPDPGTEEPVIKDSNVTPCVSSPVNGNNINSDKNAQETNNEHCVKHSDNKLSPSIVVNFEYDENVTLIAAAPEDPKTIAFDESKLPAHQQLIQNQSYRVESPKPEVTARKTPALGEVKKSRSMDDNEMLIQEISDTGSTSGENEYTPIVSEAESEEMLSPTASSDCIPQSMSTATIVDLNDEEEALIQELAKEETTQSQRARRKAAIESHFMPQFHNPKFLDVIKEESDATGSDRSGNVTPTKIPTYEELDDDVFLDSEEITKRSNAVFPKSSFDFSTRRKHVSRLRGPQASVIREEPPCVLVGAKLVDAEPLRAAWTTSSIESEPMNDAELVYLTGGSSSSSASDLCDLESTTGDDADAEDQEDGIDENVRIHTPIIGGAVSLHNDVTHNQSSVLQAPCSNNHQANSVPDLSIPAACHNNMFPAFSAADILAKHNIISRTINGFTRQDSSGSLCSTISHSTSHSQSTARFNPSPPRDVIDFEENVVETSVSGTIEMITLRQLCLERITRMPYGYLILEELAHVAGSLGALVSGFTVKAKLAEPSVDIRSPTPPPIPALPTVQSWMGYPQPNSIEAATHQDTSHHAHQMNHVSHRERSPIHTTAENESSNDVDDKNRLLAIIRDASDQSATFTEPIRSHTTEAANPANKKQTMPVHSKTTGGDETTKVTPSKNISQFSTSAQSVSSSKSTKQCSSFTSSSSTINNSSLDKPIVKHFSESSSTKTGKCIENGKVVYDYCDSTKEKSSSNDKDCIKKATAIPTQVNAKSLQTATPQMKSDVKLDRTTSSSDATASSTIRSTNTSVPPMTTPAANSTADHSRSVAKNNSGSDDHNHRSNGTITKHAEYFDHDRRMFSDFNKTEFVESSFIDQPENEVKDVEIESIIKPIAVEEDLCKGRLSHHHVRAPRITEAPLARCEIEPQRSYDIATHMNHQQTLQKLTNRQSMIEQTPISTHMSGGTPKRRLSLPKDLHDQQLNYIRQKELELHEEYDKLEQERRMLLREIEQMQVNQSFQDFVTAHKNELHRSTSHVFTNFASEAELMRQKMHDEWLDKVAEREERRMQKIIKITRPSETEVPVPVPAAPCAGHQVGLHPPNLGNEFLDKVKERRTKLKLPSDSDCESGAESHPEPRQKTPTTLDPALKVIEGHTETDVTKLPSHLREFAREFTKREETTSRSSAITTIHEETSRSEGVPNDGELSPQRTGIFELCVALVFVCWTVFRSVVHPTTNPSSH